MNKWQETVKRVAKQHPGKSLREILPLAKLEYKKMGHHSSGPTKKHKKHHKKHHKKMHSHKKVHSHKKRPSYKRRKGMRGGGAHCGSAPTDSAPTGSAPTGSAMTTGSAMATGSAMTTGSASHDTGPVAWHDDWTNSYASVEQSGGSHCGTHDHKGSSHKRHKKRRKKRKRTRKGGA